MKKFWLLALWITLIAWTLAGCWSNKEVNTKENIDSANTWASNENITSENNVVKYNDEIINLARKCTESEDLVWTLYDAYTDDNTSFKVEDIQTAINNTIKECNDDFQKVNSIWDWDWDSLLKDWALEFIWKEIEYYQKFSELLPYLTKWPLSEEEMAIHDSLLAEVQAIDEKLWEANENLGPIQKQFSIKYNFELDNDEENDELTVNDDEEDITNEEITE